MWYPKSPSFIESLMDFCMYDDILDTIWITEKSLHFKLSKSSQILHVDKTSFPRPGHSLHEYVFVCVFVWSANCIMLIDTFYDTG